PPTTETCSPSLHDALPIFDLQMAQRFIEILQAELGDDFEHEFFHTQALGDEVVHMQMIRTGQIDVYPMGSDAIQLDPKWAIFDIDRKSTRLNSSHVKISYA